MKGKKTKQNDHEFGSGTYLSVYFCVCVSVREVSQGVGRIRREKKCVSHVQESGSVKVRMSS